MMILLARYSWFFCSYSNDIELYNIYGRASAFCKANNEQTATCFDALNVKWSFVGASYLMLLSGMLKL
jgi:hypothetical protein